VGSLRCHRTKLLTGIFLNVRVSRDTRYSPNTWLDPVESSADAIRDSRIALELPRLRQSLSPNRFLDCGARKAVRRSSSLLPLLQGSFRDLQRQRGLTLGEILALTPRSQLEWERMSGQALMPRMMRSCPESHAERTILYVTHV